MYDPSSYSIYFKLIFDELYSKIPQKAATRQKIGSNDNHTEGFFSSFKRLYKNPLPITLSKCQDLQKIKKVLPNNIHPFYEALPHCNTLKPRKGNI